MLIHFEKKWRKKHQKNNCNALIDVKMNWNSDVKIFKRGATFIPGATSIPDSRVDKKIVIAYGNFQDKCLILFTIP